MTFEYLLMTPGPVRIPTEVLRTQAEPMIHHRTPEFEKIFLKTQAQLRQVFCTQQPVLVHASSGTGAMEAAVVNTLSPGDEVLCVVSGKFGERWEQINKIFGMRVHRIAVPWGESVDPQVVDNYLKNNKMVRAVFCQACETSTAVLHPIQELARQVARRPQTLMIVDGITAIGVTALPMDDWGIDVLIGGSQKTFMLPTGLSFISYSKKAQEFLETSKCPKFYWDAKQELKSQSKGNSHFSAPVSLVKGLSVALDIILERGLNSQIREFEKMSKGLRAAGEILGFKNYSQAPCPSVTAFLVPSQIDSEVFRDLLETKYNVTLMGGQDQLKGKIIRIGTLGAVTREHLRALLSRLELGLLDFGVSSDIHKALEVFDGISS